MNAPREFSDLASFMLHLTAVELGMRKNLHRGLEAVLVLIEKTAKDEIGHYQPEAGEFPAWAPLAASTEAEKARLGAPPDAPLLRHGGLYASFGHEVHGDEGVVGSTDPTLIFHEFGTTRMPPRPVLGPAVFNNRTRIEQILGRATVEGILGGELTPGGKAYFGGDLGD